MLWLSISFLITFFNLTWCRISYFDLLPKLRYIHDSQIPPRFIQQVTDENKLFEVQIPTAETNENTAKILKSKSQVKTHAAEILKDIAKKQEKKIPLIQTDPKDALNSKVFEYEAQSNLNQAEVLEHDASRLSEKADRRIQLASGIKVDITGFPLCNITKIGALEYVPAPDDLLNKISNNVQGRLYGGFFSILYKNRPKITYEIEDIVMPIYNVPNTGESYHFNRNAWINALTEAWFCQNEGLQGILPSTKVAKEKSKDQNKKNNQRKNLIDIELHMSKRGVPKFTLNGKDITPKN